MQSIYIFIIVIVSILLNFPHRCSACRGCDHSGTACHIWERHKCYLSKISSFITLTWTPSTTSSNSYSLKLFTMTFSKKKKSSTSLHISRPHMPRVRTVRLHQADSSRSRTSTSTSYTTAPVPPLERSAGTPLPTRPESTDAMLAEQMNQSDMLAEHYDSTDEDLEATEGPIRRTRTKVMSEWLIDRQAYLYEMLRHDGQEGQQAIPCASCGRDGSFSCSDCAYCMHYCRPCLISHHRLMPFHRVKV